MPAEARRLQIVELLTRNGSGGVSVHWLADHFGVSEMTIRRDLDWLEERAALTRVHGGALSLQNGEEKPFDARLNQSNPQKAAIGRAAAQLVKAGERILLDAGTTTQQVARNLVSLTTLTIITNNVHIASDLAPHPHIETILLGGMLKHQEMCTVGPMVTQFLAVLAVDKLFLSAAGFDDRHGISDQDLREVEVKQAMMRSARETILVCDSSKWNMVRLVRSATWGQVRRVVTDDRIPPEAVEALQAAGVEVLTPERMTASNAGLGEKGAAI
jgi:DeoR family transcriptional regulator, fructose operon transcriptional repressor